MKIYGKKPPDGQKINSTAQNAGKIDARGKAVSDPNKTLSEKVEISSKSKEVTDLIFTISKMPCVREDKIKAIRDALTSGTYLVDPRKIAEKILKEL